ncbi:MAG TPA: hypothetical protein VH600_10940 [Burkholderiales bacterium]|jgi:hypothetical protein
MKARLAAGLALIALTCAGSVAAQSKNLAPGFESLPKGARVAIMPTDIELFVISAGGVVEPKADWTETASRYFKDALLKKEEALGLTAVELSEKQADELDEVNALHGAIARAIAMHHFGELKLPTKDGKLDWSMGDSVQQIKQATGADYALFSFVRDSYASDERKATMAALTILTLGRTLALGFGTQSGYASLVDLNTGRVVWFNQLQRGTGDLREPERAAETLDALLREFPVSK